MLFSTYTSSGLAHYLLCGDSLSTNFLLMTADCYNPSTNRTFDFDNALCIRVCIEQPLISAAWTSYMYFFLHDSTLQSHTVIIWRAKSAIFFRFDWNFQFCLFPCRKDSAPSKLNSAAIQKPNCIKIPSSCCYHHFRDSTVAFNNKNV